MYNNIKLSGLVSIYNGHTNIKYSNHLLNNAFKGIFDIMLVTCVSSDSYYYLPANSWYIKLGTDTITSSDPTMTDIISPIEISPSLLQIITKDGESDGVYSVTYRCIWDIGVIEGTISEMGLFMKVGDTLTQHNIHEGTYNPTIKLISRLSNADIDFTPITINPEYPLIIDWTITFQV